MNMNNSDEKKIKSYFDNYKREIPNNGFTNGVMNKIPQKEKKGDWVIVVFTFLGMFIALLLVDVNRAFNEFLHLFAQIPYLYILIFVAAFPLAFLSIYYLIEKEKM